MKFEKPLRTSLLILTSCLIIQLSFGADSRIQHVELYPSGATVTREVTISPSNGGITTVEVDNLTNSMVGSSFQILVAGDSDLRLSSFRYLPQENPVTEDDFRTKELRDALEEMDAKLNAIKREEEMNSAKINFHEGLAKSLMESLEENASVEALELAETAWDKSQDLRIDGQFRQNELERLKRELSVERNDTQRELDELVNQLRRLTGVVKFDLEGDLSTGAKVVVRYQVREAGWSPVHEVRATPSDGTIEWVYKARIHQNSGEDWNDVTVALNSAAAFYGGQLPQLPPLFLDKFEGRIYQASKARGGEVLELAPFELSSMADAAAPQPVATTTGFYIRLNESLSLESGQEPVIKQALAEEMDADFWSQAVPQLSTDAWLMAGLTNDMGFPILPGELFCYIDGQLVSRRHLGGLPVGEEMELSLGRNENIIIERKELLRKESRSGIIDRTRRHDFKYETIVENRMPVAHKVILQDRFPIGRNEKIQVRISSPKDVEPEEGTGLFKWERILQPGGKTSLLTEYSVIYPADWELTPNL